MLFALLRLHVPNRSTTFVTVESKPVPTTGAVAGSIVVSAVPAADPTTDSEVNRPIPIRFAVVCGLRKGYRGRFGMYLPPLLEALGLAEVTHDAKNNKMRAK
jgi:hypothetical protein